MRKTLTKWRSKLPRVGVPILGAGLILFSIWLNSKVLQEGDGESLPETCHANASQSRIALESAYTGDTTPELESQVITPLEEALSLCRVELERIGTSNSRFKLESRTNRDTSLSKLHQQLTLLLNQTRSAWAQRGTAKDGDLPRSYDTAFNDLAIAASDTRSTLNAVAASNRSFLVWGNVASLILLLGLFFKSSLQLFNELKSSHRTTADLAKLSLVADKTDNVVLITDPKGKVEWINRGFTRISGWRATDAQGQKPTDLLFCTSPNPRTTTRIERGFESQKHFEVESLCTNKSGQRYWLSLNVTPVRNQDDQIVNFVAVGVDASARKRAEEELAKVNHQKDLVLNAISEGICGVDLNGRITFANPAAAKLTGWAGAAELTNQPISAIVREIKLKDDYDPESQEETFSSVMFKDQTIQSGNRNLFRHLQGDDFPVDYVSTPIREGNELIGYVINFRDVSDTVEAESMRSRQSHQFALKADIAFAITEGETLRQFLQASSEILLNHLKGALARIWTFDPVENQLNLQASSGLHSHTNGQHGSIALGTMKVGIIAEERMPQITTDLSTDQTIVDPDWVKKNNLTSFVGFPLILENNLVGVIGVYSQTDLPHDTLGLLTSVADSISQAILRKRVEEKAREQAALLDKSQDAIVVLNMNNRCVYWNKSAERLYGWPAEEAQGKTIDELIYRDPEDFDRAREHTLKTGEFTEETEQCTRSDNSLVVECHWTLVEDEAGQPKSFLLVNTDLSERKKIETQFLRTQRMESIGTLAGGIAHDLNNVLSPIMMSVELLKEKFPDDQSQRMLTLIESSTRRGADMVKQVLTFARGAEGEHTLMHPGLILNEIAKMVKDTFPKTIQINTDYDDGLSTIIGDATQLHQVFVNLAVNARDAMPNGGTIQLTARNVAFQDATDSPNGKLPPGDYIMISVADSGCGMSPELLEKIFEPFYTTKELGKGTGLGLSTAVGIVKSHGGTIHVDTEQGKGTCFSLYIPAAESPAQAASDNGTQTLPVGHGETILAVDDEEAVLSMMKETLEVYGYKVITATDGTEAIATYSNERDRIGAVVTDILMPHMDGPATIRVLKKMDPNVKIIAASGLMDIDKVRESTGEPDITFIQKPYNTEKLLGTLDTTLRRKEPVAIS